MTELGFLESREKRAFSFSSHYDVAYSWTALFCLLCLSGRLKFTFSFLGLGSIGNVFFIEKCVAKFQSNHYFSSQIKFYWKAHMFSNSENILAFS
jgi:hypothetical protein